MVTAFVRTILLYCIIMLGLRLMGKRQIGELEPTELVLTMLISDLAAVPMQDFGIPLLNGVVPIVTLLALSMLLSYGCMRSIRLRRLVCGSPTTLIKDGQLQQAAMRANRFTLDELIEALRSQGVTDLTTVKYAILETDGQLSVLLYPAEQPATRSFPPAGAHQRRARARRRPCLSRPDARLAHAGAFLARLSQPLGGAAPHHRRRGQDPLHRKGGSEMRHWLSPLLVLALLFGGAMANARYVSKSVDGWCAGVEAALAAAEAEDWEGAREALGAVYASWDARQTYFHIMVEHAELDAAEALFAVSHSFAESEDGAEFRANTAELLTQLRLLNEMEEISIKNIL